MESEDGAQSSSKAPKSDEQRQEIMSFFRGSHHKEIQRIARLTEYEWSRQEDLLVVNCPFMLTAKELGLSSDFFGTPVLVQFSPRLSFLNPDRNIKLARRMVFAPINNPSPEDTQRSSSQSRIPGSCLKSFTTNHETELSVLRGQTNVLVGRLRDEIREDVTEPAIAIVTSDWDNAAQVEKSLHNTNFEGKRVLVIRDVWNDCCGPDETTEYQNGIQMSDHPFWPKIIAGNWLGDMTASAVFDIEITERGKRVGRICPAMLQCRHGYENCREEMENPKTLVGKRVIDPGASRVRTTLLYVKGNPPSSRETHRHDKAVQALTNATSKIIPGNGTVFNQKQYGNHKSKSLKPLSVGKIRVAMDRCDACFVEIAPSSELGRSLAKPANTLTKDIGCFRDNLTGIITNTDNDLLKTDRIKSTYDEAPEMLVATYGQEDVLFFGANSGIKPVRVVECASYVYELLDNRSLFQDKIYLGRNTTWRTDGLLGMVAVKNGRSDASYGDPPVVGGDPSGPVFTKEGVFLGIVKGRFQNLGVGFFVPFSTVRNELMERGMRIRLL